MNTRTYETILIGGGQAGLATAYYLTRRKLPFLILDENEEVGAAWRKRWDSLRLFTPGRYSSLPGMRFPGRPGSYPGKDDVAEYLVKYARKFNFPMHLGVKVSRLFKQGDRFHIHTSKGMYYAKQVVVATGGFYHPRIPDFATELNSRIHQLHSSEYRTASQIRTGPVLVVGAGQSGAEIALDMARKHQVWLSGRDNGEEPVVRGTLSGHLLTPIFVFAARKILHVGNPLGRKVRKHFFYPPKGIPRAGGTKKLLQASPVQWVGRTTGTKDGYPVLEDEKVVKANTVIWCTGFQTDYRWIDLPIFGRYGYPKHRRGVVSAYPGLYFIGLPFQWSLSSSLILGVGRDARYITRQIASLHREIKNGKTIETTLAGIT